MRPTGWGRGGGAESEILPETRPGLESHSKWLFLICRITRNTKMCKMPKVRRKSYIARNGTFAKGADLCNIAVLGQNFFLSDFGLYVIPEVWRAHSR